MAILSSTVRASARARASMWSGVSVNTLLGMKASLRIYEGVPPMNADSGLGTSNSLLASLPLASTPVVSTTNGEATLGAIASADAGRTGTASFWRIVASDGMCEYQGDVSSVAMGSGSLLMKTTSIVVGATISCGSGSIVLPG